MWLGGANAPPGRHPPHATQTPSVPAHTGITGTSGLKWGGVTRRAQPQPCRWCGRDVSEAALGRRRQYCRQSCRQRAYEQRASLNQGGAAVPDDAVVLSADEAADLSDRIYQVRCAAEDVATALSEGAETTELRALCDAMIRTVRAADGWRRAGV